MLNEDVSQKDITKLFDAFLALSKAHTLDDVMQVVRISARELSEADGVTFVLRDNGKCYYAEENAISPLWKGSRFPLESCISGWAMTHRETVSIIDIYEDERIPHDAYRPTFVKSLAMVPVRKEDPIAAIGAYWATLHQATEREIELLQTLADCTALALANVELYNNLRSRADEYAELLERAKQEIANRERLENELRQSQKMEAVGRLAGGIAHDFNNLLTVINGYSDLLLKKMYEPEEYHEVFQSIYDSGMKASTLTRQLLAFSRKQVIKPEILLLNEVIDKTSKMLKRLIGENIELHQQLTSNLKLVEFDPGQFEQIIMNLAVNARDAMPSGGILTIETANAILDENFIHIHPEAIPGDYVMIAVTDTGIGMNQETQSKIFEPFFTTKGIGKGTGLGLSTVYGIVKQYNGFITVFSEEGIGTTFKVFIPQYYGDKTPSLIIDNPNVMEAGNQTILVVEDDAAVRKLICISLSSAGYQVIYTENCEKALQLCEDRSQHFDLLLTDVIMPKMSGLELSAKVHSIRPTLKIAFMSGYTDDAVALQGVMNPGTLFIEKPILPSVLLTKLKDFLAK